MSEQNTSVAPGLGGGREDRRRGGIVVREYVGQLASEAVRAVRRAGLRPGLERSFGYEQDLWGQVVAQEPAAGQELASNGHVRLFIAAPSADEEAPREPARREPQAKEDPAAPAAQRTPGAEPDQPAASRQEAIGPSPAEMHVFDIGHGEDRPGEQASRGAEEQERLVALAGELFARRRSATRSAWAFLTRRSVAVKVTIGLLVVWAVAGLAGSVGSHDGTAAHQRQASPAGPAGRPPAPKERAPARGQAVSVDGVLQGSRPRRAKRVTRQVNAKRVAAAQPWRPSADGARASAHSRVASGAAAVSEGQSGGGPFSP
jgi:hypothetical protein